MHGGQGRAGVDDQPVGEVAAHLRVAVERGRAAVHRCQRAQQGSGRGLVVDPGGLEQRQRLAVLAEGAQGTAEHGSGLGAQPAAVVAQGGQRAVTAGCRWLAGQRTAGRVAGDGPVAARLCCGRLGHLVVQREDVDRQGSRPSR